MGKVGKSVKEVKKVKKSITGCVEPDIAKKSSKATKGSKGLKVKVKKPVEVEIKEEVVEKEIFTECVDDGVEEVKVRRGRPKKVKFEKEISTECANVLSNKARILKHLGYCSNVICNGSITNVDIVANKVDKEECYRCIRCGTIQKLSSLLLEKKTNQELFDNSRNVLDIDYDMEDYGNTLPDDFSDLASNIDTEEW